MDPDPPMPPPSRSPVLRVSTSSSSLAPSRGLLASPSMSSASTSFSNRKSVARNLKAHIVSVKIQDPSDDIESVGIHCTPFLTP